MVILNEVIDIARVKMRMVLFKVNFDKTYDSFSWCFLGYMLRKHGFDVKWKAWLKDYVFSSNIFVSVNGFPMEEISI